MSSSSSVIFSRRRRDNNGQSSPDVVVVGRSSTRISFNKLFTLFVVCCMIMIICYIPSCRGNDEVGEVGEDDNEDYRD